MAVQRELGAFFRGTADAARGFGERYRSRAIERYDLLGKQQELETGKVRNALLKEELTPQARAAREVGRREEVEPLGYSQEKILDATRGGQDWPSALSLAFDPRNIRMDPLKAAQAEYYKALAGGERDKVSRLFESFNQMVPRIVNGVGPGIFRKAAERSGVKQAPRNAEEQQKLREALYLEVDAFLQNPNNPANPYEAKLGELTDFPVPLMIDSITGAIMEANAGPGMGYDYRNFWERIPGNVGAGAGGARDAAVQAVRGLGDTMMGAAATGSIATGMAAGPAIGMYLTNRGAYAPEAEAGKYTSPELLLRAGDTNRFVDMILSGKAPVPW